MENHIIIEFSFRQCHTHSVLFIHTPFSTSPALSSFFSNKCPPKANILAIFLLAPFLFVTIFVVMSIKYNPVTCDNKINQTFFLLRLFFSSDLDSKTRGTATLLLCVWGVCKVGTIFFLSFYSFSSRKKTFFFILAHQKTATKVMGHLNTPPWNL